MDDRGPRSPGHHRGASGDLSAAFRRPRTRRAIGRVPWLLAGIVVYAGVVYFLLGLHGPKWRFTSLLEFSRIVRAAAVLSMSLLVLDYIILSPNFYGSFFFGKITIALYFVIQTVFLSGTRIAYRYLHDARTQRNARNDSASPTLILGRAADVDVSLRAIENGAIRKIWPVGLLSPADSDQRVTMRGVPVMGRFEDLENVISVVSRTQHHRFAAYSDGVGVRAWGRRGKNSDRCPPPRIGGQPNALAGGSRRSFAAGARCGRGFAAAAEREDRLQPPRKIREGKIHRRDRRRRIHRRGDMRSRHHVRRGTADGFGKFRAGAACRFGILGGQTTANAYRRAHCRRARPRSASFACSRNSSRTSYFTPRR